MTTLLEAMREVLGEIDRQALSLATPAESSAQAAARLWDALLQARPQRTRLVNDGRAVPWRVRIQLFDDTGELQADSDHDSPLEAAGETEIYGLPAVAEWLVAVTTEFHGGLVGGLGRHTLKQKLRSLRPMLSRGDGWAVWRVPYTVMELPWLARVDVRRVEVD